jgi:hypothetical protein
MSENYNRFPSAKVAHISTVSMDDNLHSPQRRLIELRMEHADLDSLIDQATLEPSLDELALRRMKKRRLALRDQISRLDSQLDPPEPA